MLCEKCKIREATVHYTEIVNGEKKEHYLCAQCAREEGLLPSTAGFAAQGSPFVRFLSELLSGTEQNSSEENDKDNAITCPNCGMTFGEFTKLGKFGCPECYRTFGPLIENEFKKFQADSHHVGKKYHRSIEDQQIEDVLGSDEKADAALQLTSAEKADDAAKKDISAKGEKSAASAAKEKAQGTVKAGANTNAGASGDPSGSKTDSKAIEELERQKAEAVKREDYMEAARLRDAIRKARGENE